jgi:threonine aldolase
VSRVDLSLFSDSTTIPTRAMLDAMFNAEVGDEQRGTDPTVAHLEQRVADLLGHEAAVFLPSGTMCNAIGVRLHIRPGGDEIILHERSHTAESEAGGAALLSGASLRPIITPDGRFSGRDVERAIRRVDRNSPRSRLVIVEQTVNVTGGRVWGLDQLDDVVAMARLHGLRTHLDGARLMNAVVASGVSAARIAGQFDTAWLDFAKGLGCPMGAALAGSQELIDEAWRYKQMWGGAMRQTGFAAAACLYALDHNVDRLAEDHRRARQLAMLISGAPGIDIDPEDVQTNIVIFGVADASVAASRLKQVGIDLLIVDDHHLRAVTYMGIDDARIATAAAVIREYCGALPF